jgi:hypothetical protein
MLQCLAGSEGGEAKMADKGSITIEVYVAEVTNSRVERT